MLDKRGRPRNNPDELTYPAATAIPPSLREALQTQADKEGRTLSRMIAYCCERLIASRRITDDIGLT